ncbi:MAG TPA: transposase [Candidatus Obscuribacterales bacterium]
MSAKRYSPEIRKIAYEAIKNGERLSEISKRLGVKVATLSDWKRIGEKPSDFGKVMPTFRSNPQKTPQKKSEEKIYKELFEKLPLVNQQFAEHLRRQYQGGLQIAINYTQVILHPRYLGPINQRQNLKPES